MRRCRGRTEGLPRLPTGVGGRGAARHKRTIVPPPRGVSGPRWRFGSPSGRRLCASGRIPSTTAWRGCGRRRLPLASRRRSPPGVFHRQGSRGTPYNASCACGRPSGPPPGIPGRCAGARSRGSFADAPRGGRSLLAADRYGEPLAPLGAPPRNDFPAAGGRHPLPESVGSFPPQVVRLVRTLHGWFAPSINTTRSNDGKYIIYCLKDHRVNRFSGTSNQGGHSLFFRRKIQDCPPQR